MKEEFVVQLQNELSRRMGNNPRLSLRAFANFLDVDQSLLSKVLKGSRRPSLSFIQKVSEKLDLCPNDFESDLLYSSMTEDSFQAISQWYHFAILELFKSDGFDISIDQISKRLNIKKIEAELALDRLERLGFIKNLGNKYTTYNPNNSWLSKNHTNEARKRLQRDLFKKSSQAIEETSFNKRDHSSLTVACNPDDLPMIKDKITKFRRSIDNYIGKKVKPREVYQLVIGFFPLTAEKEI